MLFPIFELVVIIHAHAHDLREFFVTKIVLFLVALNSRWELIFELVIRELVSRWVQIAVIPVLSGSLRFFGLTLGSRLELSQRICV